MPMQPHRAPEPQMMVENGNLYVINREWLYLFDAKTLELKSMENLDLLAHEFMQKAQQAGRLPDGR